MIFLSNMSDIFLGTLTGVLVTLLTAWLGIRVAVRLKLMDIPGALPRKQHQLPTPYAGGIALLLSLLVLLVGTGMWRSEELRGLFVAVLVIFVFGIWDDYKKLRPVVKLCGQLLAAIILIYSGIYIRIFESTQFFIGGHHEFIWLDWGTNFTVDCRGHQCFQPGGQYGWVGGWIERLGICFLHAGDPGFTAAGTFRFKRHGVGDLPGTAVL